jgi:transcriptional regulator with XRE-family HTH domain
MGEIDVENFTKNFRSIRKARGFTQESLAEKINTTHATVNRWESGQHKPNFTDFYKLMQALEVSFEELAGVKEMPSARQPTPEEAMNTIASHLGMEIRIVRPFGSKTDIPPKILSRLSSFSPGDKVWELIEGVINGLEKSNGNGKKKSQRA